VCEFSEGGARRRCVWWVAASEFTVAHRELGMGSVGDGFVHGGNRFVNGADGGLCGWTGDCATLRSRHLLAPPRNGPPPLANTAELNMALYQ
jgi:hypothetical protein